MQYNPQKHHRRSIRLKGYDYEQSGVYFVTICSHQRECIFGEIDPNGVLSLSEYGHVVETEWLQTPVVRPYVELDAFVIMPNHLHGIVVITGDRATQRVAPTDNRPNGPKAGSLGAIVGSFKSVVTRNINELRGTPDVPIWQHGYYDVIIRDGEMLSIRRQYIESNPSRWAEDENNPLKLGI